MHISYIMVFRRSSVTYARCPRASVYITFELVKAIVQAIHTPPLCSYDRWGNCSGNWQEYVKTPKHLGTVLLHYASFNWSHSVVADNNI
jgi:hypothetical protein